MIKFSSGSKFGINVNMHVKASSDRKWAGNERAGDKIRTMSSYSIQTLRVLSKFPMYKLIVLILSPARSLPARPLSFCRGHYCDVYFDIFLQIPATTQHCQ